MNNYRLCSNILRAIEGSNAEFPALETFPVGEYVHYLYLRGRLYLNSGEFNKAEDVLEKSFVKCPRSIKSTRKEILVFLISAKSICGKFPSVALLIEYGLFDVFGELLNAVKNGNIQLFQNCLFSNQQYFIEKQLMLLFLIHMKDLLYRNLFHKVYKLLDLFIYFSF